MDQRSDLEIMSDFFWAIKLKITKFYHKLKQYIKLCLERSFNSYNENDRREL